MPPASATVSPTSPGWKAFGAVLLIAATAWLAYANTLAAPFAFDDTLAILHNASIRQWSTALFPPVTAGGAAARPLVNLSLAVNHALGGTRVEGYHVLNLLIHTAAGLALFGLVRRTLRLPRLADRWRDDATPVALLTALLWTAHPLLTESVTCIVQRTESLVGLWYLLLFYCLARAAASATPARWRAAGFIACLLGMGTKEVMVTAPVLAFLFHVALVDGSWREAWARRGRHCLLLALTWVPLLFLVWHNRTRDGAAGLGLGVSPWEYALTQCRAIILYLQLSFWPHPLVLDYGDAVVRGLSEVWPQALLLVALLAAAATAWVRRWPAAFAGAWFFLILAPSSSVVPLITQTVAEHRMYLPLAAVVALVVTGVYAWTGRRGLVGLALLVPVLAVATWRRNELYRSPLALWQDTVAHAPDNPRAHTNLGNVLDEAGQAEPAERAYRAALQITPGYPLALNNLGTLLLRQGRLDEAVALYAAALRANPISVETHTNYGSLLARAGRWAEAQAELETALRLAPDDALAHNNLANVLFSQGRADEAVREFRAALPKLDHPALHMNLAVALAATSRPNEAIEEYQLALRQDPTRADARYGLGLLLLRQGRRDEARAELREALRLRPDYPEVRELLRDAGLAGP